MLMRPLELGASIVIHSATKYLAGHGDVLGGVVISDAENFETLNTLLRTLGPNLGPFEAYLTMRGIKTLALRMEKQCANACQAGVVARERIPESSEGAFPRRPVASRRRQREAPAAAGSLRRHGGDSN